MGNYLAVVHQPELLMIEINLFLLSSSSLLLYFVYINISYSCLSAYEMEVYFVAEREGDIFKCFIPPSSKLSKHSASNAICSFKQIQIAVE